jgi:hypothetical protein
MPSISTLQWLEIAKAEEQKLNEATKAEQFRFFALKLVDAPYGWGKENLFQTDCSGTLSFPLYMMGYDIRVTADYFFKHVFTKPILTVDELVDVDDIMAVFYVTKKERQHGDRVVPVGTATHVTPVVGQYVVLHAGDPVSLNTAKTIRTWYPNHDAVWRKIDWKKADKMHKSGQYAWDVDPVLKILRG